jgi:large subunit ribosomal protein L6
LTFAARNDSKFAVAMSGTTRALVNNMVSGVSEGFTKTLLLQGVGYRAAAKGSVLNLTLGFFSPS